MKNLSTLLLIAILFFACEPKENNNVANNWVLSNVLMGPTKILEKKGAAFNVGVRYFNQQNILTDKETIAIEINGATTKLISKTPSHPNSGPNAVFEASTNNTGEQKLIFKVKSGETTFTRETPIKIVSDYEIATVWEALNYNYVKNFNGTIQLSKDGNLFINARSISTIPVDAIKYNLGEYRKTYSINSPNNYASNPLVNGIDGVYSSIYTNQILQEINVYVGNEFYDSAFKKNTIFNELAEIYGAAVISTDNKGNTLRTYTANKFDIVAKDASGEITIAILKVR